MNCSLGTARRGRRISAYRVAAGMLLTAVLAIAPSVATAAGQQGNQAVDLTSLLEEMTDLAHLASFPEPAYKTLQASSYDRRSKNPDQPTDEDWFANGDASNYLRTEENNGRKEWVMMDHQGPGAVVRIWSANPNGTLRVYLDGQSEPALEANMEQLLGGKVEGIPEPIAGVRGRGYNLFLPIPFAKSCKITSDTEGFYYIVNFRSYADGTEVKTFSRDQVQQQADAIEQAAEAMQVSRPTLRTAGSSIDQRGRATLSPGQSAELFAGEEGPGAIDQFVALVRSEAGTRLEGTDLENALRQTELKISFDDKTTVQVPLGDFFGSAPGINPYATLPMAIGEDGSLHSRWVMPFEKGYRIEVINHGEKPVEVIAGLKTRPWEWSDRSMHFHASYYAMYLLATHPRIDMPLLEATGKGVYVGTSMAIDNPTPAWWGEGDEKVYVDGEEFPSWFGTGTEDYFGYAWCDTALFEHAYHSQSRCDGPRNYGRTSVNRFHIIDAIPFQERIQFDLEMWHWENTDVHVATVAYWYGRPDASQESETPNLAELDVRPMPEYVTERVEGAIEGEEMAVIAKPSHTTADPQHHGACKSNEQQMWWRQKPQPGDELVLAFRLPEGVEPGEYRLMGRFLKAPDYGIVSVSVNGTDALSELDLYHNSVVATEELDLGTHQLRGEGNEIRVTVRGKNPKAVAQYMFGLDYVRPVAVE